MGSMAYFDRAVINKCKMIIKSTTGVNIKNFFLHK